VSPSASDRFLKILRFLKTSNQLNISVFFKAKMKPISWLIVAIMFSSILVVRNQQVILSEASLEGDDDIED